MDRGAPHLDFEMWAFGERDGDLQGLQGFRQEVVGLGRFADEQVNVFRHDNVAEDFESVTAAGTLEGVEEDVS